MSKNIGKSKSSKPVVIKKEEPLDDVEVRRRKRSRLDPPSDDEVVEIKGEEEDNDTSFIKNESPEEVEESGDGSSDGDAGDDMSADSDAADSPVDADVDDDADHSDSVPAAPAAKPALPGVPKRKQPVPMTESDDGADADESESGSDADSAGADEFDAAGLKAEDDESETKPRVNLFAAAVADILGAELPDGVTPVLAKSKKKNEARRKEREIKKERRKAKEEALARKLLADRDHVVPDHSNAEYEAKLKKIATRGVVQLFNAINKQQRQDKEQEEAEPKKAKTVDKLSKEKFLELLQKAPIVKAKAFKPVKTEMDD